MSVHWSSPQLVAKLKALVAGNKTKKFNTGNTYLWHANAPQRLLATITRHLLDDQNQQERVRGKLLLLHNFYNYAKTAVAIKIQSAKQILVEGLSSSSSPAFLTRVTL